MKKEANWKTNNSETDISEKGQFWKSQKGTNGNSEHLNSEKGQFWKGQIKKRTILKKDTSEKENYMKRDKSEQGKF